VKQLGSRPARRAKPLLPTPSSRSARMARIRAKNTQPEMAVRRLAHAMGFRFRLHRKDLPGSPDLVFPRLRKVVFVHGCFWHLHRDPGCRNAAIPKTRTDWWIAKLERNCQRDAAAEAALRDLGWDVLVLWECEIRAAKHNQLLAAFLSHPVMIRPAGEFPGGTDPRASPSELSRSPSSPEARRRFRGV